MTGKLAERIVGEFFYAYLVERDMERALEFLSDSVQWIGTGRQEIVMCKQAAEKLLEDERKLDPNSYRIKLLESSVNPFTESCCVVLQRILVIRPNPGAPDVILEIRVTAAVADEGAMGKILSIHASTPAENQKEGEFFPTKSADETRSEFEKRVNKEAQRLSAILMMKLSFKVFL